MNDAIEISAYDDSGKLQVKRLINGVVSQRMIVGSDRQRRKVDFPWQAQALDYLQQPSAGVVIEVPPVPPLQPTREEVLLATITTLEQKQKEPAFHAVDYGIEDETPSIMSGMVYHRKATRREPGRAITLYGGREAGSTSLLLVVEDISGAIYIYDNGEVNELPFASRLLYSCEHADGLKYLAALGINHQTPPETGGF